MITTDANGYFKLKFEPENSSTIDFKDSSSYTFAGVLHEKHVYVDFIQKTQCTHKKILLVNDSLSEQDTFYLGATGNGEVVILPGTFYNNQTFNISIRQNIILMAMLKVLW